MSWSITSISLGGGVFKFRYCSLNFSKLVTMPFPLLFSLSFFFSFFSVSSCFLPLLPVSLLSSSRLSSMICSLHFLLSPVSFCFLFPLLFSQMSIHAFLFFLFCDFFYNSSSVLTYPSASCQISALVSVFLFSHRLLGHSDHFGSSCRHSVVYVAASINCHFWMVVAFLFHCRRLSLRLALSNGLFPLFVYNL